MLLWYSQELLKIKTVQGKVTKISVHWSLDDPGREQKRDYCVSMYAVSVLGIDKFYYLVTN